MPAGAAHELTLIDLPTDVPPERLVALALVLGTTGIDEPLLGRSCVPARAAAVRATDGHCTPLDRIPEMTANCRHARPAGFARSLAWQYISVCGGRVDGDRCAALSLVGESSSAHSGKNRMSDNVSLPIFLTKISMQCVCINPLPRLVPGWCVNIPV